MDWNRKELDFLTRAADIFDLPADVIGSLPHIELIGDCHPSWRHQEIFCLAPLTNGLFCIIVLIT